MSAPAVNEGAGGIVLLRLFLQIELPQASRVRPYASQVLPVAVVASHIIVDQLLLKPCRSIAPVQTQFIDEAAGHQLPGPIAHVTGFPQLIHCRVYDRVFGVALAPGLETMAIEGAVSTLALDAIPAEKIGPVFQGVPEEILAPEQLEPEPVCGLVFGLTGFVFGDGFGHFPDRQAAVGEPG